MDLLVDEQNVDRVWNSCKLGEGNGGHVLLHWDRLDILARQMDEQNGACVWVNPCQVVHLGDERSGCHVLFLDILARHVDEQNVACVWDPGAVVRLGEGDERDDSHELLH